MNKTKINILLSFDFGMKKIGVAVGQTVTGTARPLKVVLAKRGVPNWDTVTKLIKEWRPDALIVGIPLNMDGTEQPLSHIAKMFSTNLADRYKLPVFEVDERLTTKEARDKLFTQGGYKALQAGKVDCVAAQLILQNWMSEHIKK